MLRLTLRSLTRLTSVRLSAGIAVSEVAKPPADRSKSSLSLDTSAEEFEKSTSPVIAEDKKSEIERRQKKKSGVLVEYKAGMTEKLFPDNRRAPALCRLHYTDTISREVWMSEGKDTVECKGIFLEALSESDRELLKEHQKIIRGNATTDDALKMPPTIADVTLMKDCSAWHRFTLWKENVCTQEAVQFLSMRLNLPLKNVVAPVQFPKDCCSAQRCFVYGVTRAMLLSLNDMRFPGFVLRVSNIEEVEDSEIRALSRDTSYGTMHCMLLRECDATQAQLTSSLQSLEETGFINYFTAPMASSQAAAVHLLNGRYRRALLSVLSHASMQKQLREFVRNPTVRNAELARRTAGNASNKAMLRTFAETNGNPFSALNSCPVSMRKFWLRALVMKMWNMLASQRLRRSRKLEIGDVVVKEEYRHSSQTFLPPEAVKRLESEDELAAHSIQDAALLIPNPNTMQSPSLFSTVAGVTQADYKVLTEELGCPMFYTPDAWNQDLQRLLVHVARPAVFKRLLQLPVHFSWEIFNDPVPQAQREWIRVVENDRLLLLKGDTPSAKGSAVFPEKDSSESTDGEAPFFVGDHRSKDLLPQQPISDVSDIIYSQNVLINLILPSNSPISVALREIFALHPPLSAQERQLQQRTHASFIKMDPEYQHNFADPHCRVCCGRDHTQGPNCALLGYYVAKKEEKNRRSIAQSQKSQKRVSDGKGGFKLRLYRETSEEPLGLELRDNLELVCLHSRSAASRFITKLRIDRDLRSALFRKGETHFVLSKVDGKTVKTLGDVREKLTNKPLGETIDFKFVSGEGRAAELPAGEEKKE